MFSHLSESPSTEQCIAYRIHADAACDMRNDGNPATFVASAVRYRPFAVGTNVQQHLCPNWQIECELLKRIPAPQISVCALPGYCML